MIQTTVHVFTKFHIKTFETDMIQILLIIKFAKLKHLYDYIIGH